MCPIRLEMYMFHLKYWIFYYVYLKKNILVWCKYYFVCPIHLEMYMFYLK